MTKQRMTWRVDPSTKTAAPEWRHWLLWKDGRKVARLYQADLAGACVWCIDDYNATPWLQLSGATIPEVMQLWVEKRYERVKYAIAEWGEAETAVQQWADTQRKKEKQHDK